MNLRVFNQMNSALKEDKVIQEKMYCDWSSFCSSIQNNQMQERSILTKLPLSPEAAKQIVTLVVQPIAANIGINLPVPNSKLNTDKEVYWSMEVIGYGLSLPLSEHDTIRDCVHVYCEWLSALLPQPKSAVPLPLLKTPNVFSRKIIAHLYHLFVPRPGDAVPDMISRQALLCHRVLRTFQNLVIHSTILEQETWDCLLLFLLAINDALLAPPTITNDIGDQLCDRVLTVLLEIWLQACAKSFPSPRLWKTLTDLAQTWRHRPSLISQWNRINMALTSRLLRNLYGSSFPQNNTMGNDDKTFVPADLTGELLAQTWYRLLHVIGNPVQLARPNVISQTHKFLQFAIMNNQLSDSSQHPCLSMLPSIFVEAMKGIATLVDTFLGSPTFVPRDNSDLSRVKNANTMQKPADYEGNFSVLSPYRSHCNSLLHLFGSWLFEAALFDSNESQTHAKNTMEARISSPLMTGDRSRASSVSVTSETSVMPNRPRSATVIDFPDPSTGPPYSSVDEYENGRAEALGALCRIFSSKRADEDILPQYLARFFVALQFGLKTKEEKVVSETMASILLHSADLLRVDLDGIFSILPSFVDALETVLVMKDYRIRSNVSRVDLRRASIHVMLSVLALPLHFQHLHIKDFSSNGLPDRNGITTFSQLRPRLTNILLSAIATEADSMNIHLLLGGLASLIHDLAAWEQTEAASQSHHDFPVGQSQSDAVSNVISSTSDTHSCHSTSSTSYPSFSEVTPDFQHENDLSFTEKSSLVGTSIGTSSWSFHGLLSTSIHLVSNKLLSTWKSDLNTSLSAVELLGTMAKITVGEQGMIESRRVVRVLCEYISLQCSRPPPAHSKDLHSTIVAAFTCCAAWLSAHPYLTADNDCLHAVLQVIELGISGSKSQGKVGDALKMKHEKDLKPVSLRVRDAAELLLTSFVEKVGNSSNSWGNQSVACLDLDEDNLLSQSGVGKDMYPMEPEIRSSEALKYFRYFATSEGAILSILEDPLLGTDQDPQPNVTVLLRNAFGKQVWASQLRYLPRHKCGTRSNHSNPGRPLPMNDVGMETSSKPHYFPDSVDRIRSCLADKSIPALDSPLAIDDCLAAELDRINRVVDSFPSFSLSDGDRESNEKLEYQLPVLREEFQTARLFLSHLGFLSLQNLQESSFVRGPIVGLSSLSSGFMEELETIDRLGSRTTDTVHIFYVRSGQKRAEEIASNVLPGLAGDTNFFEFLLSLGWSPYTQQEVVEGNSANLFTAQHTGSEYSNVDFNGGVLLNGISKVLYWADGFSEMFFILPSDNNSRVSESPPFHRASPQRRSIRKTQIRTDDTESSMKRRPTKQTVQSINLDLKLMVVWLESFEDCHTFPLNDLLAYMQINHAMVHGSSAKVEEQPSECFVIFIHPQQSGLYRIHLSSSLSHSRSNFGTPLVDGAVVPLRILGHLVRETSLNMAKRRRLEQESYQVPHVRRKLKIAEFVSRYRLEQETPSFYTNLFS